MMDINLEQQDQLPQEFLRAIDREDEREKRTMLTQGWGATTGGKALTGRFHERLTEAITVSLLGSWGGTDVQRLVPLLKLLPPKQLALCVLQNLIKSIGDQEKLRSTLLDIGIGVSHELWAAKLLNDEPKLAAKILHAVRRRYHGERRVKAARQAAINAGYLSRSWSRPHKLKAGAFFWNIVSTALPEVFELVQLPGCDECQVALTDQGLSVVDGALDKIIVDRPVFWPIPELPKPWTAAYGGGVHDERVSDITALVRSRHKSTQAAVRHAIKSGAMKPALDAINTLQAVPFKINRKVLEVIDICTHCLPEGSVPGFPGKSLPYVAKLSASKFERLSKRDKAIEGAKRDATRKHNAGLVGDRVLFRLDTVTANAMLDHERFYTPMNMDWRGRVYALSHFNFQREDRVRALFLFADGLPIGEEGLRWLKIHTANCGDFGKISKRSLEERVTWCDDNTQLIGNIASEPLVHTEWMQADKPFLFLAACFELAAALEQGPSYTTQLPISFDGSCSGLQHLCAMTRAAEGSMVNLTPSPLPQDVYQTVSDDTFESIKLDLENPELSTLAQLFLDYTGDRRKGAKRNVMTYSYSSKKFGMASQQQVDLMDPLSRQVLEGTLEEHPFVGFEMGTLQRPSKAARYFASHIFDAIETRIHLPAAAMHFLQKIAKALAHEGKPVTWTSPVGLPWINRYHEPDVEIVQLLLADGGVKRRTRVSVATGDQKEIDKDKAANGVAPNFVHALDASHLLLVASASAARGIANIATVHDSFGCLAPQAMAFNQVIREQFAEMYETHDVLAEILAQATCDLTEANRSKLPALPTYGNLNLKDIINADFAFA